MTVPKTLPSVAACEAGESNACRPQSRHRQAVMDAGAILLGMRFSALRYDLHDETLP